jgi:excinuclease ABC subunit C
MQSLKEKLLIKVKEIPRRPGIYIFKNNSGGIIYIGKATVLRDRVASYFRKRSTGSPKTDYMITKIADIEFIVTENEVEALLLENNLIKKEQPRYNFDLKDDKSYPYIKLTIRDKYPTAYMTRNKKNDGAHYYGPYVNAGEARHSLQMMRKHLLIRSCTVPLSRIKRPCLMYHLHRCLGPCRADSVDPEKYSEIIKDVQLLLDGRNKQLIKRIEQKMIQMSDEMKYEQAASYRDFIKYLKKIEGDRQVAVGEHYEEDIIGYHYGRDKIVVQLFHVRKGLLVGRKEFILNAVEDLNPHQLLRNIISRYYFDELQIPPLIVVPESVDDSDNIAKILSAKRNNSFRFVKPKSGRKKRLLDLAMENAKLSYKTFIADDENLNALRQLQKVLKLETLPEIIEGFDISTLSGESTVGSTVVFSRGKPDKSSYRRYKIKTVEGIDDYASMKEIVARRYKRLLEEEGNLPDLILIDGGPGQLNAANEALESLGIFDIETSSIAKKEELIYLKGRRGAIRLERTSPALKLLQSIRDEAHRFAINYQRKNRRKIGLKSTLEEIPGIGPNLRKKLLLEFESIDQIKKANTKRLAAVIGKKRAEAVLDYFRRKSEKN